MKNFDVKILKEPLSIFAMVMVALTLLGGWAYYEYLYNPLVTQKEEVERRKTSAELELNKINERIKKMDALEKALETQQQELQILRNMFPDEEVVTSRLRDLHRAFRSSGIEVTVFEPVEKKVVAPQPAQQGKKGAKPDPKAKAEQDSEDPTQYYNTNLYKIELVGGYHMIGDMFAEIANFPYPTLISELSASTYSQIDEQIELAETQGWTPYTMNLKFILTTFTSRK